MKKLMSVLVVAATAAACAATALAGPSDVPPAPTDEPEALERMDVGDDEERPPMAEPSATQLGVPRYPGAVFDPRNSAGMSSDEETYFIYTTADPAAQVEAFYQRELKLKPMKTESGAIFAVKGSGLFPELGVVVQPNVGTYPEGVKTMITVRHGESEGAEED